jgi:hypothetical protein
MNLDPLPTPIPHSNTSLNQQLAPAPAGPVGLFADRQAGWGNLQSKPNVIRTHHRANSSSGSSYDVGLAANPRHRRAQSDMFFSSNLSNISTGPSFEGYQSFNGMFDARQTISPSSLPHVYPPGPSSAGQHVYPSGPSSARHIRTTSLGNSYRRTDPNSIQNSQFAFMNTGADMRTHTPQSSIGSLSDFGSPGPQFNHSLMTPSSSFTGNPFPGSPQMSEFYRPETPPYDSLVHGLGGINMHVDSYPPPPLPPPIPQGYGGMMGIEGIEEHYEKQNVCMWGECNSVLKNVADLVEHIIIEHIGV